MKMLSAATAALIVFILSACGSSPSEGQSASSGSFTATGNFTNTLSMQFVTLPAGSFTMGSNSDAAAGSDEGPNHSVTLSAFSLSRYETTYNQWTNIKSWAEAHGYSFSQAGDCGYNPTGTAGDNPVVSTTWDDVVKWCNALSEKEGRTPVYYTSTAFNSGAVFRTGTFQVSNTLALWDANGYRLPTEAEWEYACRAGTSTVYWWGNTSSTTYEYTDWNLSNATAPVGQKQANPAGLNDMGGNVHEWVWDRWPSSYSSSPVTNPRGPDTDAWASNARQVRGGHFWAGGNMPDHIRSSYRRGVPANINNDFDGGFRLAVTVVP